MNFEQLKNLVNSVVGTVSEKGREYAGVAVDKTKAAGRIAKLTLELNAEKESVKKAYAEIGQAYWESCREGAEGPLAQLCEEVDAINARVALLETELAELKAELRPEEPEVEVTFEEVVEAAEQEAEECSECCCEAEAEKCCCEAEAEECCCEAAPVEEAPVEEKPEE